MAEPVETKVKASSAFTYLVSVAALAIVGAVDGNPLLISSMPDAVEPFVRALLPAAASAVAGWAAPHTPRGHEAR
jgi:hypothetical protein